MVEGYKRKDHRCADRSGQSIIHRASIQSYKPLAYLTALGHDHIGLWERPPDGAAQSRGDGGRDRGSTSGNGRRHEEEGRKGEAADQSHGRLLFVDSNSE